ncbi:MAG TPA: hypothetical protein VGG39_33955 [Polyangiaceae bacterium]|jgi:hypothetical protein
MRRIASVLLLGAAALTTAPARADTAACIAASESSLSLRQQGKLHAALERLAVCADASCPDEVKTECARRIDSIDAAMPTLILAAKDGTGNDLSDVTVTMDGAPLLATLDGRPARIDPGEHVFVFTRAGQPPVEKRLVLREGERDRREEVVLGPVPPPGPSGAESTSPAVRTPSWWTTQRILAVAGGGLGLVGIGLGTSWGLYAVSAQNQEKSHCSGSGCPNPRQANEDYSTAKEDATASTIAFAAGGVLLAAGAVLFFTSHSVQVAPTVGTRGAGLAIDGGF